jgi:hypothetical protein
MRTGAVSNQWVAVMAAARSRVAWLVIAAIVLACRSAPLADAPPDAPPDALVLNSGLSPIDVRYGLDIDDVELGILLAVARPRSPLALDPGETITDEVLSTILASARSASDSENPWHFVDRSSGLVEVSYRRAGVSMRVAIKYDAAMVLLRIVESRNLGQTDTHIRAEALALLDDLDDRIRETIIEVAQRNQYGSPLPANR